ncbi:MAG: 3-deoxy-manno-octulosonate cytidylyltransferase [bacterium]|nr:MAG: 3-deoxy-manno-octulosonate cytidylyltransferase [bacterium]
MKKNVAAVIPARYGSTRFEGKLLAPLKGKPVIIHVVERAHMCRLVDSVLVATDDDRIFNEVQKAGYRAVMTSADHTSGSDRVAEAAGKIDCGIVVNLQGDEPMLDPASVDACIKVLLDDPSLEVSTLAVPITDVAEFQNPDAVKVVVDNNGLALYFSRAPIPYDLAGIEKKTAMMKHLGLYVFRRSFLLEYAALKPTELEMTEKLEQLRILQHGFKIRVVKAFRDSIGIDTPEDLVKAEALLDV